MTDMRGKTVSVPRWLVDFSTLCIVTCSAFAAFAQIAVLIAHETGAFQEEQGFSERLILKALLFVLVSVVAGAAFVRRRSRIALTEHADSSLDTRQVIWHYAVLVGLALLLFAPNLHRYPWPAPDELHHLIVARNLAEHHAYASGMAPDNLVYFDVYDSVGPAVIGPTAAAILPLGASLVAGRLAVMLYAMALPLLTYGFLRPLFGARSALLGAMFTFGAYGTVYLSRSLYGEVPAFALLLGALILWRSGLKPQRRQIALLIASGVLAGLAVLSKSFLLVGGFAFATAIAFDALTLRRVSPRAVLIPATVTAAVLVAWELFVAASALKDPGQVSLMVYYRHLLVFGLPDALPAFGPLQGVAVAASVVAMAFGARHVLFKSHDPALLGLLLMSVLYVFWWIFFTPMHIARYLWYSAFVAAMLCGPLVVTAWQAFRRENTTSVFRSEAYGALIAVILLAFLPNFVDKTAKVVVVDQAHDERALLSYVAALPESTDIATRYWPAERLLNFGAHRKVELIEHETGSEGHDVLIDSTRRQGVDANTGAARIGHYLIYESRDVKLARDLRGIARD